MWLWKDLFGNLAVFALFIAGWGYVGDWLDGRSPLLRRIVFGAATGLCAVAVMQFSVRLSDDLLFDLRLPFVAMSGFVAGPVGAAVAVALTGAARLASGDANAVWGTAFIAAVGLVGIGLHRWSDATRRGTLGIVLVSAAVLAIVWLELLLSHVEIQELLTDEMLLSVSLMVFSSTLALGLAVQYRLKASEDRRLTKKALEYNRNMLSYALAEMSDGLAMFDAEGVMTFCNDRFKQSFPLTSHAFVPGASYKDIFTALSRTGEDVNLPSEPRDDWMYGLFVHLREGNTRDVHLKSGRWLKVRARPTRDGMTILTASDFTEVKQAQDALLEMTDQLKSLAATDGLTGLMNRREFDRAFREELRRSERENTPVSLLLIDVDRFKVYNDLYGHLAGDDCLRAVSQCIEQFARRPGDHVARFGGEEFVVILANTDEAAAMRIAEDMRAGIMALGVPHEGNETKVVTVSLGMACYCGDTKARNPNMLIQRADEALYRAKHEGRNRVIAWSLAQGLDRAAG